MDPPVCTKRRKTDQIKPSPKQVDAHIRAFINAVITSAQRPVGSSSSAKEKLASVVSKSFVKRKRNVPRCDASTQTEEEAFIEPPTPVAQPPPSPTALLSENAAAYYASTSTSEGLFAPDAGPSNTDLQYFASESVSRISSSELRQLLTNWMRQYEQWFYQNFGVDVNSVPTEIHAANTHAQPPPPPPPPPFQQDSGGDRAVACQTPFRIRSEPVMYPQPLIYAPAGVDPLASILSAQVAAQNLLSRYIITQQTQQQEHMMAVAAAAAAAASMAALPTPIVCLPPAKSHPVAPVPATEAGADAGIDPKVAESPELCGPVTQYGAYGILRPCPLDVMDDQNGNGDRGGTQEGGEELPIYITPEDYRHRPHSWMPPPPPTVLLIRKQTLVCVMQMQICKKAHEIDVRKASATKTPVIIDYVAALESTVERYVKVKVTYVFNRISRLPTEAQTPFIGGLKRTVLGTPSIEKQSTSPLLPTQLPVTAGNADGNVEDNVDFVSNKPPASNSLDIDEGDVIVDVGRDEGEEVKIDAACEGHSRAMYICDLLIGDIFICQALADCKFQAKTCAARKALTLLSRPNFLVGAVRTWYSSDSDYGAVDYLTLCLSPKADQVPQLTPFLADPLAPIPSDQPVCPGDPAESYRVCNPKPFHDLWLYTALPIAVDVDNALAPEQFLAQSAEFSQMTVNFEVEFDSTKGAFTAFGLVDAQRCANATSTSVVIARANAASRLLRRLKTSQPVVGLLLPPPDPGNEELAGPRIQDDEDSMHPLWGLTEASIVDSLMWGKHEKQFALPIEHLEAHCEIFGSSSADRNKDPNFAAAGSGFFTCRDHLEQYLEAYAASALVTPLRISLRALPHALWHMARTVAHSWGLLTRIEFEVPEHLNTAFLLVCKRAPLPRLKRTLFERTEVGVFYLLSRGDLPPPALHSLSEADLLDAEPASPLASPSSLFPPPPLPDPFNQEDNEMEVNDPLTRMARTFHATAVKQEASGTVAVGIEAPDEADLMLVSAELNQPSNAVEILDDLPRQLIPGIDF